MAQLLTHTSKFFPLFSGENANPWFSIPPASPQLDSRHPDASYNVLSPSCPYFMTVPPQFPLPSMTVPNCFAPRKNVFSLDLFSLSLQLNEVPVPQNNFLFLRPNLFFFCARKDHGHRLFPLVTYLFLDNLQPCWTPLKAPLGKQAYFSFFLRTQN